MAIDSTLDASSANAYEPSKTALLLLDWYSLFIERLAAGSKGTRARDVTIQFRRWAKAQGIIIIHCLIDVNGSPFPACKGRERSQETLEAIKGSGNSEPAGLRDDSELYFYRVLGHISALKSPGLLKYLQEQGIKSLILTGLSTSGCVLRTALAGTDDEFAITVISDACADRDEDLHRVILDKILPSRGHVKSSAEFQHEFEGVFKE
ncbi:hypothetical protein ACLX1H_008983 [Fusarium chlamydosporum]